MECFAKIVNGLDVRLNSECASEVSIYSPYTKKYGLEKTPNLDTFHSVLANFSIGEISFLFSIVIKELENKNGICEWSYMNNM